MLISPFLWPFSWLSAFVSDPHQLPLPSEVHVDASSKQPFALKEGHHIFSPKDLLELPRPGAGVANPFGDLIFVSSSQYSFETKKTEKTITVSSLDSNITPAEILGSEAFWLDDRTLALVSPGVDSGPELLAVSLEVDSSAISATDRNFVGALPQVDAGNYRYATSAKMLVFSAHVYEDHNLTAVHERQKAFEQRGDSALIYDNTYMRHWDTWRDSTRQALFSVGLFKDEKGVWILDKEYFAPLQGTGHHSPVEPFGGTDCFDVSSSHIIYVAKATDVTEALHTRQHVHIVPIKGDMKPHRLTPNGKGATSSPTFNKNGDKVAWLQMEEDGNEADRNRIILYDLVEGQSYTVAKHWDRSPDSIKFSLDGTALFITAGDLGRNRVFAIDITSAGAKNLEAAVPIGITTEHSASAVQPLRDGRVLFTQSSFTSPNNVFVLSGLNNPDKPLETQRLTSFGHQQLKTKTLEEPEEFWFKGASCMVHGWAIKPPGFKAGHVKKYPVVLLIHGGPQSAWEDQWSTRWNPNVWAQQGYFVVAINPTGSTTYGQRFTDGISEDWGGKPFVDLRKGWAYALETYPEIDPERAVAAGASWGGYAINWIQGHPEFFNFKALVCHDGVFDTLYSGYVTDELYFFNHEFGGNPATKKARKISEKWNPARFTHKWSTPQLVIHGGRDYRLPETEGISAFQALQVRGVKSRFIYFPDENHWVIQPGNSLLWHTEIFKWFNEIIGENDASQK